MDDTPSGDTLDAPHAESSSAAMQRQSPLCVICQNNSAIYTCPRCNLRTCSLSCSAKHKALGDGCSGLRNKAAYVPMNQYGYMSLMSDYTFLEEMGRKVGDWGREIVQRGYNPSAAAGRARGRGRGRGRGGARGRNGVGAGASKRDVLKMQLDFRDIEVEYLANGMERRTLNQSTWDNKNRTALLTLEVKFHPPRDPLAPPSQPPEPPFVLLTHRTTLETPLLRALQTHVEERARSKRDKEKDKDKDGSGSGSVPAWVRALVFPDADAPEDAFAPPFCTMPTPLDPLAALSGPAPPRPGRLLRRGYYRLDPREPLGALLRHKHFVEFPTVEVWDADAFEGTLVDERGAVVRDAEADEDAARPAKRRKMSARQGREAMSGLLGGYGSDEEGEGDEEQNVLGLLGGYAESDEEEGTGEAGLQDADEWGDEDAEGETDDEYEDNPEQLAAMLQKLREAGALRDPGDGVFAGLEGPREDQVDWGESGDEDEEEGT